MHSWIIHCVVCNSRGSNSVHTSKLNNIDKKYDVDIIQVFCGVLADSMKKHLS